MNLEAQENVLIDALELLSIECLRHDRQSGIACDRRLERREWKRVPAKCGCDGAERGPRCDCAARSLGAEMRNR